MIQIEDEILTRCQGGDKAAFRWVVQTYQRMLFSLALKMLADEEEAKDVVQDTFVRAWLAIRSYNPQQPFASWLYTIASRLCLNRMKAEKVSAMQPKDLTVLHRFASGDDTGFYEIFHRGTHTYQEVAGMLKLLSRYGGVTLK